MSTATRADVNWTKTRWNDEPAWTSTHAGVRAIVSEKRCRLVHLGPEGEAVNLLSAPARPATANAGDPAPNQGGHRFWLGPQSRWKWPPVADWEFSAAAKVSVEGSVLHLEHPHAEKRYPAMTREYAWEGARLRCTVRWAGGAEPFYAMHVVAVNAPTVLEGRLHAWDRVPLGVVGIRGDTPNVNSPLPHPAVTVSGGRARARSGVDTAKLGFFPQTLTVSEKGWLLHLHPGPAAGIPLESPDYGYLSQIWVGPPSYGFAEIEQLTPFLLAAEDGRCASTVFLEVMPAPPAP